MDGKENIYQRYKTYLRLEKALAANTIEAYLADLDKLVRFVESEGKDIRKITYDDLQQFVAQLHDVGIHARSQARIISGIKSFYKYLLLDGYIESDPTELLEPFPSTRMKPSSGYTSEIRNPTNSETRSPQL